MAAVFRWSQSRIVSYLYRRHPQPLAHFARENPSWQQLSSSNAILFRVSEYLRKGVHTSSGPSSSSPENEGGAEKDESDKGVANSPVAVAGSHSDKVSNNVTSSLKVNARHDLALIFTCKKCETRSMKTVCRESYEKGVVVVRCGGCENIHLIADRLGWFGQPGSVEDLLAARGEEVKKGSMDSFNFTLEDLAGKKA